MLDNKLSISDNSISLRPVQPGERIYSLDVIRGFAMLGVLLAFTLWNLGSPPSSTFTQADRIINELLAIFVDTKCYTLFATLFGLGLSMQMNRSESRGVGFVSFYSKRLAVLMVIGLVHAVLLRNGDILVPYAVMGFVLLPFRNASKKTLLAVGAAGLLLSYFGRDLWQLTGMVYPRRPNTEGFGHIASNLAWLRYWYLTAFANWPATLPMFAFGIYLGRTRFYENVSAYRKRLRVAAVGGFVLGLAATAGAFTIQASGVRSFAALLGGQFLFTINGWLLAASYGSTLLLLVQRRFWQRLFTPVAAVGRMALTNYLLQAALIVPVCIVFGLFDKITPTTGLMLAAGVWSLQLPFSVLWLNTFRFGPAEWLWRSLTYGHFQPMQKSELRTGEVAAIA